MRTPALVLLLLLALGGTASAQSQADGREAAEAWLGLVDAGQAGQSWDEASAILRNAIDRAGWEAAIAQARGPLGPLSSRNFSGDRRTSELPGVPPGDYLIIQYATSFENRKGLTEVVTMVSEDGRWNVAGYFVR